MKIFPDVIETRKSRMCFDIISLNILSDRAQHAEKVTQKNGIKTDEEKVIIYTYIYIYIG